MEIINILKTYANKGIDTLFPAICPLSGEFVDKPGSIHGDYWRAISFITPPYCKKCGFPHLSLHDESENQLESLSICAQCLDYPPLYDAHRAPLYYDETSKILILKFKHQDQQFLVHAFTPWLVMAAKEFADDCDFIIPVPLHFKRILYRKYNQAGLLAQILSKHLPITYAPLILKRIKATQSQRHKSPKERKQNVKGAFAISPKYSEDIKGKNIMLIDDVYTTGSTLNACTKALKAAGANKVYCITIARVIKD